MFSNFGGYGNVSDTLPQICLTWLLVSFCQSVPGLVLDIWLICPFVFLLLFGLMFVCFPCIFVCFHFLLHFHSLFLSATFNPIPLHRAIKECFCTSGEVLSEWGKRKSPEIIFTKFQDCCCKPVSCPANSRSLELEHAQQCMLKTTPDVLCCFLVHAF